MIRIALICLAVTGCVMQSEVVTTKSDRENMGRIAVVSILEKNMQCNHQGYLEYDIRKAGDKNLKAIRNELFSQKLVDKLNGENYLAKAISDNNVTYTDRKVGASSWENIKINSNAIKEPQSSPPFIDRYDN